MAKIIKDPVNGSTISQKVTGQANLPLYGGNYSPSKKPFKAMAACWESHPPVEFEYFGTKYRLHGGNCQHDPGAKFDTFIGFDHGFNPKLESWDVPGRQNVLFKITDFSVPKDVERFRKFLSWLHERVIGGHSIYMGCIGGHGRTGMVLCAYLCRYTDMKDPLKFLRKNYCTKAVETDEQIDWLSKHFGLKTSEPAVKSWGALGFSGKKAKGPVTQYKSKGPHVRMDSGGAVDTSDYSGELGKATAFRGTII